MKININDIRLIPEHLGFGFCVFGEPSDVIKEWSKHNGFILESSGKFTNIIIPNSYDLSNCFLERPQFSYLDGFSPNLNKNLHIGHMSNLIIAKSMQCFEMSKKYIAILGDTLEGEVSKADALGSFKIYCSNFNYHVDDIFMASDMLYDGSLLVQGDGDYAGTKIFKIDEDEKIVGIKSNGQTSYFLQDVSLASKLHAPTLYLTGSEQIGHFKSLKKLFPHIEHIGLGLVTVKGKKMSSRDGNVIYAHEVVSLLMEKFKDLKLCYNVLAGQILKSTPSGNKDINMDMIDNVKTSSGLYMSYTAARLKSAGVIFEKNDKFNSNELEFKFIKSKYNMSPNILFEAMTTLCKKINALYATNIIKGNKTNEVMFSAMLEDLELGIKKLGMFSIEKV